MNHQLTFADCEFNEKRSKTRKEIFLARMDALLPWSMMLGVIDPVYPKAGNGHRPYPLDTMLRIHCMQQWYNPSDSSMEDVLYEIASMRLFAKLSLDLAIPHHECSPSAGAAPVDPSAIRDHQPVAIRGRYHDDPGYTGRCHHYRGAKLDQKHA